MDAARRAVVLRPENYAAQRTLGWATHKAGRSDEAKAILDHALSLNPDDVMTHVMLADVLVGLDPSRDPQEGAAGIRRSFAGDRPPRRRGDPPRSRSRADGYAIRAKAAILDGRCLPGVVVGPRGGQARAGQPDRPSGPRHVCATARRHEGGRRPLRHGRQAQPAQLAVDRRCSRDCARRRRSASCMAFILIRVISRAVPRRQRRGPGDRRQRRHRLPRLLLRRVAAVERPAGDVRRSPAGARPRS